MKSTPVKVYGAWLYRGSWDGKTPPPLEDWKLLRMAPGRFTVAPPGFKPKVGQVTLLGQGETVIVIIP